MSSSARGRPHGAAPTDPNRRGGLTPPHPALRATFPPRGKVREAAPYAGAHVNASPCGGGAPEGGGRGLATGRAHHVRPYAHNEQPAQFSRAGASPRRFFVRAISFFPGVGSPRPTRSALSVGADVLIGPRAATQGRPYENFDPLLPVGADLRVRPPVLGAHCAPLHGGGGSPLPPLAFGHLPLIGGVVPRPTWFASSVGADLCVRPAKATPPCLTAWGCIVSCDRWGPLTPAWRR